MVQKNIPPYFGEEAIKDNLLPRPYQAFLGDPERLISEG